MMPNLVMMLLAQFHNPSVGKNTSTCGGDVVDDEDGI